MTLSTGHAGYSYVQLYHCYTSLYVVKSSEWSERMGSLLHWYLWHVPLVWNGMEFNGTFTGLAFGLLCISHMRKRALPGALEPTTSYTDHDGKLEVALNFVPKYIVRGRIY